MTSNTDDQSGAARPCEPREPWTYTPLSVPGTESYTAAPAVPGQTTEPAREPGHDNDGDRRPYGHGNGYDGHAPAPAVGETTTGNGRALATTTTAPYGAGGRPDHAASPTGERVEGVVVERPPIDRGRGAGAPPRPRGVIGALKYAWPLLLLALTKAKWLLVIFKFKAFTTFGTALLSIAAYALFWGLPFAIGFVALLFVHEMGHALVLKRQGVKATAPLFIPFMGAVIGMKELPKNVYAEAQMALGGPIVGSIGALVCLLLWQVVGSPLFLALAYFGFWLNLFNLIPVSPLDGGRAMAAISRWGWVLGLALLALLFLRSQSLFLGFILLVGGMEVFNRWRGQGEDQSYYTITGRQRLVVTVAYFGLAALLALGTAALQPLLLAYQPGR